jgi:hypothetical protein
MRGFRPGPAGSVISGDVRRGRIRDTKVLWTWTGELMVDGAPGLLLVLAGESLICFFVSSAARSTTIVFSGIRRSARTRARSCLVLVLELCAAEPPELLAGGACRLLCVCRPLRSAS